MLAGPDSAGVFEVEFERMDRSFPAAVLSAVQDFERVFPEATILRVEPDDLVTIAAIAERVGRSHESVRLLARGADGLHHSALPVQAVRAGSYLPSDHPPTLTRGGPNIGVRPGRRVGDGGPTA
jgi:hypothetical protein